MLTDIFSWKRDFTSMLALISGLPFLILVCLCISPSFVRAETALDTVNLQLRWHHQFQFAGYYAALEQGYYQEEGLDVRIQAGDPSHIPVTEVLSGNAQYGVGNSEILFQRLQGKPLVALATVFQHSPSILLSLKSTNIHSAHDLVGKKVMLANKNQDADFLTMLVNEGVSLLQLDIVPSSYDLNDLIKGEVDAFNAYITNEPYILDQLGIAYDFIDPVTYRVDFYSDILFTSEAELDKNPERVAAMRRASLKGWRYAMQHPDAIIELILEQYSTSKTREHLMFEADEMRKLIVPDLVQIGHMNPERWQHMAGTFVKADLVESVAELDGFIYDPSPPIIPRWIWIILCVALFLVLLTTSITFYLHRFNRYLAETKKTLLHSEERFKALSEATCCGIIIHNDEGEILECNIGLTNITGYSYAELIGMRSVNLVTPEHQEGLLQNALDDFGFRDEVVGLRKDKSEYPLAINGKHIIYKGQPARIIEWSDITENKATEDKLKLAASVFTHAREGIMICDAAGDIIDVNDTFSSITGYSREEVLGTNPRFLESGRHSREFFDSMWSALLNQKQWSGEIWNKRKTGEIFAELITISAVSDANGKLKNYVALFSDITSMKQHQQQLEHIAHYDTLTDLPNRIVLSDRLLQAMNQSVRRRQFIAVAYLDLDGFKTINDTYGHDVGDDLLIMLSKRMSETLRESDTLARIGGDEFVALLVDLDNLEDCKLVLSRMLQAASSPFKSGDNSLLVSASIGVTLYPQDNVSADQLIRHADQAMYSAKQTGKNRYHFFDINQSKDIQSTHEVIESIRRGIEQDEFVLYYQPKVNMQTGTVIGCEALIRWQHPDRGLLLPGEFLPVINKHPISLVLGDWVINNALSQMTDWQTVDLDLPVSVNIDAYQLQDQNFVTKLSEALALHPTVPPHLLELEILETNGLADMMQVLATMQACIDIGVSFALDDFGTGFSSLTYLKRLPASMLKIDQSFVRDMLVDLDDRAIVMGVISLASAFHLEVIAEGVESIEHGSQLMSMGCMLAQGYGIARPMPAEDIPLWNIQWVPDAAWLN
ncbi:EAL domain-containing protein [Shewanella youngdeokensis]|uniref:EAL domain-containing protein n=1 Tax=Shewanella youngdeokensis TaxID=2999068 RepID=A0ABZ0JW02_9GAMM|nr:EAL domain-containing protein [Shewanella sp. DAU334]